MITLIVKEGEKSRERDEDKKLKKAMAKIGRKTGLVEC